MSYKVNISLEYNVEYPEQLRWIARDLGFYTQAFDNFCVDVRKSDRAILASKRGTITISKIVEEGKDRDKTIS